MTLHELVDDLTKQLQLTPEQMFRVTAQIKRLIHDEKADVYHRMSLYMKGDGIYDRTDPENPIKIGEESPADPFNYEFAVEKYQQHQLLAKLADEELVTWDVGSHKFNNKSMK